MLQATKCPNCDEEAILFSAIGVISCGHCAHRYENGVVVNQGETREQEMERLLSIQEEKELCDLK